MGHDGEQSPRVDGPSIRIDEPTVPGQRKKYSRSYEVRLVINYEGETYHDYLVGRVTYFADRRGFGWNVAVSRRNDYPGVSGDTYIGTVHDPRRYDHYVDAFFVLDQTIKDLEAQGRDWWTIDHARWI